MSGSVGNESLIYREPVRLPDGSERRVPALSGNALRHCSARGPGVRWLVGACGLDGSLTLAQLNFLFHGGSLTESTGRENTARLAELFDCCPLLRLLGGCLPDQIVAGALRVSPGVLVCEENRDRVAAVLGEACVADLPPLLPAERFVGSYQYATYDAKGREPGLAARATDAGDSASDPRMLYAGQCVQAGAYFAHDYTVLDPTTPDLGALLWSLELWHRAGAVVGGMSARGHGRLSTSALIDGCDVPAAELVAAYLRHARANAGRFRDWLHAAFTKPAKAGSAAKKGRGKKVEPEPEAAPE